MKSKNSYKHIKDDDSEFEYGDEDVPRSPDVIAAAPVGEAMEAEVLPAAIDVQLGCSV